MSVPKKRARAKIKLVDNDYEFEQATARDRHPNDERESIREDMLADAARSGLTAEDCAKLGFEPITPAEATEIFGNKGDLFEHDAYKVYYFDAHGNRTNYFRVRWLNLDDDEERELGKYRQPPNTTAEAYMPPLGIDWPAVFNNPEAHVFITEGEKKAAAMCKAGFACIGLGGVDSFQSSKHKVDLLDELKLLAKRGNPMTIVFDSDQSTKPRVQKARAKLIDVLTRYGADAAYADIEPDGEQKLGLDDLIERDGPEAITALLETRQRPHAEFDIQSFDRQWLTVAPPPRVWAWDERIVQNAVTVFAGEGGIGKSLFLLKLVIGIAVGASKLAGAKLGRGPVLLVSAEDRADTLRERIYYYRQRVRSTLSQLLSVKDITKEEYDKRLSAFDDGMCENFKFLCVTGRGLHLIDTTTGEVKQAPAVPVLAAHMQALGLVAAVFDPMSRLHGGDENASAVGTAIIDVLEHFSEATKAAIILAHHTNKESRNRKDSKATSVRGSTAIVDGARSVFTMSEVEANVLRQQHLYYHEAAGNRVTVTNQHVTEHRVALLRHAKANYAKRALDTYWVRTESGLLTRALVEQATGDETYRARVGLIRAWAPDGVFTRNMLDQATKDKRVDLPRDTARATLEEAVTRREATVDPDYKGDNPKTKGYRWADTRDTRGTPAKDAPRVSGEKP